MTSPAFQSPAPRELRALDSRHARADAGPPRPRNRFAARIAAARRRAGLSRQELADQLAVTSTIIALWEDDSYEGVDLAILERVALGTGLRLEVGFAAIREERHTASKPAPPTAEPPLERSA